MAYGLQPGRVAALKQATRDLLDACAGPGESPPQAAVRLLGVAEGTVSRWISPDYGDLLPLAAALRLEGLAQAPIFSALFASATGHRLVPLDGERAETADLMAELLRLVGSHGSAVTCLSDALADGRVVPGEARDGLCALGQVETVIVALKRRLTAIRAGEV